MSKIIVYPYTTYKQINQFSIGYMINPSLHVNKAFREKNEKSLRAKFRPWYKSLMNKAEDGCNDSTDTSHTDKEYSVDNMKAVNNKSIDEE